MIVADNAAGATRAYSAIETGKTFAKAALCFASQIIWMNVKIGNKFSRVTIDPNSVPLNQNRVRFHYAGTIYKPPRNNRTSYVVGIQVFGNYK